MNASDDTAPSDDRDLAELDDVKDREELRERYQTLLQELRVVLPGVQVLLAFLLTTPFTQRFTDLDKTGRDTFGFAMVTAMLSVACLLTPTIFHRVGGRQERKSRLAWGIRLTVVGLLLLALSLLSGLWCVSRFVFGSTTAWWLTALVAGTILLLWFALPAIVAHDRDDREQSR
jgi:MFS family permease